MFALALQHLSIGAKDDVSDVVRISLGQPYCATLMKFALRQRAGALGRVSGGVPGVGGHAHGPAAEGSNCGDAKGNNPTRARAKSGLQQALTRLAAGTEGCNGHSPHIADARKSMVCHAQAVGHVLPLTLASLCQGGHRQDSH